MLARAHLTDDDQRAVLGIARADLCLPRHTVIQRGEETQTHLFILKEGCALSALLTSDGRQFAKVHLPGDLLGLTGLGHNDGRITLRAANDVRLGRLRISDFIELAHARPSLTHALVTGSQREALATQYLMLALTRMDAEERMAFLLRRFSVRLGNGVPASSFVAPLTQENIGDALGLTAVHVNRVLKKLVAEGILASTRPKIEISDLDLLSKIAEFADPLDQIDLPWFSRSNLKHDDGARNPLNT